MMKSFSILVCGALFLFAAAGEATIFSGIRGIVHDPQHLPVSGAEVTIQAQQSDWKKTVTTNADGEFQLDTVPLGIYEVTVRVSGFNPMQQQVTVSSSRAPILHFQLTLAIVSNAVEVSATPETINPESVTTETVVSRKQIAQTPGADRTNSLAMITDYTPGAYIVHDQLHIRGGHQVSWLIDGVPVPNTNIASNVGPQFDPKDIDTIEIQRGGYSAEFGDRAFGVFNVVTRSGFERNNEGEWTASYGNFHSTNDQLSFGGHTDRFAYYGSVNANRTDLGLETPTPKVLNDLGAGLGGFVSLIFNVAPTHQLRLVSSVRGDHYQVPNTPDQQADGIRDVENERDAFVNFSWVHNAPNGLLFVVSPFYHFNRAHYVGGPHDTPVIPESDRGSNYIGGVATMSVTRGKHNARLGFELLAQRDNTLFRLKTSEAESIDLHQREILWGNRESFFLEDQFKMTSWLTLTGGLRFTRFSGSLEETAVNPRLGAAIRLPHLNWVLRGFYGRYYQAPPLSTVSGPVLDLATSQGFGFLPLRGERDEQYEFGLAIPMAGWVVEGNLFHTRAENFLDHDVLGNSNIFFPLTLERARIRGWEATVRSPRIGGRTQVHLAYSHQMAEARGGVSGGLTDFTAPDDGGFFFLDHDQRNTLSTGAQTDLPWHSWAAVNLSYGSGFLDGNGPSHLPHHSTIDLSLGKSLGRNWSVQFTALNIADQRHLLDNSNTFGGTHFSDPRQVSVEIKYRFKY